MTTTTITLLVLFALLHVAEAQPTSCPAGEYLDAGGGFAFCANCPSNQACLGGTSQPVTCSSGQTPNLLNKATACITASTTCNPGSYLNTGLCIACTDPNYGACLGGTAQQADCSQGFSTTSDMKACITTPTSCTNGSALANLNGQNGYQGAYCYLCNSSGTAPYWSFSSTICPDGINNVFCPQFTVANYLATACVSPVNTCPAGQFAGSQTCRPCPVSGYACPGGSTLPILCGTGKVPSADKTMCIWDGTSTCNAGTYPLDAYTSGLTTGYSPLCVPCPTFTICTGGLNLPRVCPAGQTPNANVSATSCVTTSSCPPGQYIYNGACWVCPRGFFCTGGSSQPAKCPLGMYPGDANGISTLNYYYIVGGSKCILPNFCVEGHFVNATGCWECLPGFSCIGGQHIPAAIANYPPTTCSPGNYLSGNKCVGCIFTNFKCPGGNATPSTYPAGTFWGNVAVNAFMNTNTALPYQPSSTVASLQVFPTTCPLGKFLNSDPLAGCSVPSTTCTPLGCNTCPAGYSCAGGTAAPVACANGLISNWNTTLGPIGSSCVQPDFLCPAGYVSTTVYYALNSEDGNKAGFLASPTETPQCMECPWGDYQSFCPGGNLPMARCALGYSIDPTAPTRRCIPTPTSCPVGFRSVTVGNWPYYWPAPGIVCESCAGSNNICLGGPIPAQATSCSGNNVPNANNTLCVAPPPSSTSCSPGSYYVMSNGNPYNGYCKPCPPGYGCPGGYISVMDKFVVRCGPGKAPAANASTCLWDGITSCPPGKWGSGGSRFDRPYCNPCPSGAICAGGSALPLGCPFGQGPNPGATACSVQTTCNAGYHLSNGRCSLCPAGYSCSGGSASPSLCPLHLVPVDAAGKPATVVYSGLSPFDKPYNNAYDTSIKGGFPAVSCGLPPSCPPGTYMNTTIGFEGCLSCPSSFACPGGYVVPIACTGSNIGLPPSAPSSCGLLSSVTAPYSCSIGYYLPSGGKYCEPCTPGVGCGQPCNQWSVFLNGQCQFVGNAATTCIAGKYLDASYSLAVCIDCPANSMCSGGTAYYIPCPAGQIADTTRTKCVLPTETSCPAGSSAFWKLESATFPQGYLWTWGGLNKVSPLCTTCDTKYSCPGGYAPPRLCPDNTVPDLVTSLCRPMDTSCPVGYTRISLTYGSTFLFEETLLGDWSNNGVDGPSTQPTRCEKCDENTLCPAGTTGNVPWSSSCNSGSQPNQLNTACVSKPSTCPAGQVPLYGACASCPSGSYCAGGSSPAAICGTGKAPNVGATECVWDGTTICAAGTYINPLTASNDNYCVACTTGNACAGGSAVPAACVAGQIVNTAGSACASCPSGFVCLGGSSPAAICGTGKAPNVGATECVWDGTTVCAAGTYINPLTNYNAGYCAPCSTGNACAGGSAAPVACVAGQIVNSGASACASCPSGFVCLGGSSPAAICGTGKAPNSGATACVWDGSTVCAAGTYINPLTTYNAGYCANCTAGKVCTGGSATPEFCTAGLYLNNAASACFTPTSCNVGDFVNASGCFPCPSTSACAGGVAAAVACGAGQVVSINQTVCVTAATTCASGNFLYQGVCRTCPASAYCSGGTSDFSCGFNIKSSTSCLPCPANANCYGTDSFACTSGYMYNAQGANCVPHPPGPCGIGLYFNSTINGIPLCAPCPPGSVCVGKGAAPSSCPPGRVPNQLVGAAYCFNPVTSCTGSSTLINGICVNPSQVLYGSACTGTPVNALITRCAIGVAEGGSGASGSFFCGNGQRTSEWRCRVTVPNIMCANNWVVNYPVLTTNVQNAVCASGGQCDFSTNIGSADGDGITGCPCPGNATCSGNSVNCNLGYMINSNGLACVQLPTSCPSGQGPFNGVCTTCLSGYACPSGTLNGYAMIPSLCGTGKAPNSGATACVWDGTTVCAAGTYMNPSTAFTDNYCIPCAAGKACSGGSAAPVACVAGQIVNSGASACASCPSGSYCAGGSSPAAICGTGKAPNSGATACVWDGTTICAPGTYINPLTTNTAGYCANCTANNACAGGSAAPIPCRSSGQYVNNAASACFTPTSCNVGDFVNATGCFSCPSTSACAGGVAAAVACGTGQVASLNQTVCVTEATTCSSGSFLHQGICRTCPGVSYCPGGSAGLNCYNSLNVGGIDCATCPALSSCNGAIPSEFTCGYGQAAYDEQGTGCVAIPPGPCPYGLYQNSTINGLPLCLPCPTGKVCAGKGALPGNCPPSKVPNKLMGADQCVSPLSVCPSYYPSSSYAIFNGLCISLSEITNGPPGTMCTGLPSTNLTTKCAEAVVSGGANALAILRCGSGTVNNEWRCALTITQANCADFNTNSLTNSLRLIGNSICTNYQSCPTYNNEYTAQGNGVSGGVCTSSGGGGGGSSCSGNPPTSGCANNAWGCTSGSWVCMGGMSGCTGVAPTCTLPQYSSCQGSTWACISPPVTGPTCTNNPNTVTCTTPGNTVQCLTGSTTYTCEPAETCSGLGAVTIPKTFCLGSIPVCASNGKWACRTCSNTFPDLSLTCQGTSFGPCLTECTDWRCGKHQTCPTSAYLNYPQFPPSTSGQPPSSGYTGTCMSPAAGSLSCPAGQFLVTSPLSMTSAPSSTNIPPAMSLQCVPCPTGYTCAGGTGATAYATPSLPGAAACPSTGSGLSSVVGGYSGSVMYSRYSLPVLLTSSSTLSTNVCILQVMQNAQVPGYYDLHPFVGCDPNFIAVTPNLGYSIRSYCIPCPTGTFSPGGFVGRCSACPGTPPAYGSCPAGQTLKCSSGAWSCQAAGTCSASGGGGPAACAAGSTWSSSGTAPCAACSTCSGPNRIVSTTCSATSDAICGCDSGSTKNAAGTGCLATAVVVMPYAISSPTLCSAAGVVESILKPTSGVALSLRGNLSVALGIPSSATFIVAVTACDSKTTLVAQNAPINTAVVPGGISGRRLQTAALNTSSLNLVIDGQTLVITLGFTIPNSVAPAMSAFLSASMSGTASPATMATLAGNLQQSIQNSGAASSPQLSSLLADISAPSSSSSSSNAASAFSRRLNSVPVSAAAPMAASLGVSVASLGITNNTVKGVPSAIAVTGNPLAVSPTVPTTSPESGNEGLGGLGALVLLVILPACGYYFLVYRKKKHAEGEKKKEGSDVEGGVSSSSTIAVDSADISFDIVSPMNAGNKKRDDSFDVVSPMHAKKENKSSFEPRAVNDVNNKSTEDAPSTVSSEPVEANATSV